MCTDYKEKYFYAKGQVDKYNELLNETIKIVEAQQKQIENMENFIHYILKRDREFLEKISKKNA